jgi:hypothetical protein
MSKLITATTLAAAQALADKAHAYLLASETGYAATKWNDVMTHPTTAGLFAIIFTDYLAPAFTPTERGDTTQDDGMGGTRTTWANVVEATPDWFPAPPQMLP